MHNVIEVVGVNIFPIKALHAATLSGVPITSFHVDYRGPRVGRIRDRHAMLINPDNTFISQRTKGMSLLAAIQTSIVSDKILVSAEGKGSLLIDPDQVTGNSITATMHDGETMPVHQVAGDASKWFEEATGIKGIRLVTQFGNDERFCDPQYTAPTDRVGLSDGFPVLIVSMATLAHLNSGFLTPRDISRFRANIIVNGDTLKSQDENHWRDFQIGLAKLLGVKMCQRCVVTTVDQDRGIADAPDMLKGLVERCGVVKANSEGKHIRRPIFGENCVVTSDGVVAIGDVLEPLTFKPFPPHP